MQSSRAGAAEKMPAVSAAFLALGAEAAGSSAALAEPLLLMMAESLHSAK